MLQIHPLNWRWLNQPAVPITKSATNKTQAQQALEKEKLVEEIWSYVVDNLDRNKISKLISYPFPLIFHAARKENIKFLRKLTDKRPDILWEVDERKQTIFHVAVYNGQEKIVQLLSEMRSQNDPRVFLTDKNGKHYIAFGCNGTRKRCWCVQVQKW